ncbi:TonB-dependent siderophore receptor [Proteus terrae]|uniref:TonB-dependent siderophore receptor n=1 Tax=Proteus terrae TaxID=1574161 RepID=UPI000BFDD47A|nr:TonB-dependent siderophore receptor [Proteus terrae]ATN00579.1 TonB-dependent siderophore receptor [Proteus vulgaris]MDR9741040.1 TonB-dependent siderophore receptor [Proteus terrae]
MIDFYAFKLKPVALLCSATLPFILTTQAFAEEKAKTEQVEKLVVSAQALKVNTSLQETPKSVSVISQKDLETHAPQKLDEALRYTSGVVSQPFGADNDTDWLRVRGFEAATYLDNSRLFRDGYYTWLLEPYGFEQIEVVKGASAVLFGESTPGGAINVVQKKPSFKPQNEVFLEVGNNDQRGLGFDVSSTTDDKRVRYRLVGLMKKSDGELSHTDSERIYLAPSVAINLTDDTSLTFMATYLHDDGTPTNPFFPAAGTLISSPFGKIKPSTNLGEPGYDKYKRTQISAGYLLESNINDVWRFSQRLNYGYNDLLLRSVYAFPNSDITATELGRGIVFRDGKNQSISFDNNVVGEWDTDNFEHTLLAGAELQYHQTKGDEQDNYSFGTINPWNPIYGKYTPLNPADNINRTIDKTQYSLYSQYQTKFDSRWVAMAGIRQDWVKTENKAQAKNEDKSRTDSEFSLNAGLMYLADNGLSPYVSYSESFEVMSTIDPATKDLYKPLKGDQIEAGVKYTPDFMDGYFNIAWFDITQKNALVANPMTSVSTQAGKVTSRGVEVTSEMQLTERLALKTNYTYTDMQTDDTGNRGKQQAGLIPKHTASAWGSYTIPITGTQDLTLGTGVRYLGKSKDNPKNSDLTVPSATLWDMAAIYNFNKQLQLQLNINNILDKEYLSGCDYYCYYGQSRSVLLNAKYRW